MAFRVSSENVSVSYFCLGAEMWTWMDQVGIIMYLPTADEKQREAITQRFFEYRKSTQYLLWDSYGAHEHWAKIEVSNDFMVLLF